MKIISQDEQKYVKHDVPNTKREMSNISPWYSTINATVNKPIEISIEIVDSTLNTRQSSTQNNKYQVSHKHDYFSWWWTHSRPKHVEIDKYTKNKLYTKLVLFERLYRDARSTK